MKLNQIPYVIFQAMSNFSFKFASPFSVMTRTSSEIFLLKYMFCTKGAHQCTVFQALSALKKVHPISHATFKNTRSGFIQILNHYTM